MDECKLNNHYESSSAPVLPSGESINNPYILKSSGNENVDPEPCERRKKTRRGKPKRKNPYNKDGNEQRKMGSRPKVRPRFTHRHADAPYNTNEFLMEDHNTFVKLNSPSVATPNVGNSRPPRVRDPSFTSVESDDDYFYSSPEDEEEFLTKEFSNTYEDLHVETLQGMSKPELIQQVLQLEEKVDGLEKRLGNRSKSDKEQTDKMKIIFNDVDLEDKTSSEKLRQFQQEIGRLRLENEKLLVENEKLKRHARSSSVSSVDSESDSTTSSPSSVSDLSEKDDCINSNVTEVIDETLNQLPSHSDEASNIMTVQDEKEMV